VMEERHQNLGKLWIFGKAHSCDNSGAGARPIPAAWLPAQNKGRICPSKKMSLQT
jgi:hypothetical protein